MRQKILILSVLLFSFLIFIFLSCGKKDSTPTKPDEQPTQVPVFDAVVELILPSPVSGKKYTIAFDTDKYISNGHYFSITGTCGTGLSISKTVKVQQGNYYITGFIDKDDDSYLTTFDFIGIYGGEIPTSVPANPNANIYSNSYFNITMTSITGSNLRGLVTFPKDLNNSYNFYVYCDTDLNTLNGIENIYLATLPDSVTCSTYSMFIPFNGTYYLYAFVDFKGDGLPAEPYDFFGYYDLSMPKLKAPASPNANIDATNDNIFDITIGSIPTPTYTNTIPPPTPTYTYTSTSTFTPTFTVTNTPTFTPTCGLDSAEPDNSFTQAKIISLMLLSSTSDSEIRSISSVGDNDYFKIQIDNMDNSDYTFDLVISTSEGVPGADTELTMYNSSQNQIAYNDNYGSSLYSRIVYPLTLPAHSYGTTFYVKVNEKGNNNEICSYVFSVSLENIQ